MPVVEDDVLILGAGAAGLACAERLHALGISFTILEARDRIGGRALTDYALAPGLPLELGAQMVHGRHVVTQQWAQSLGLTTRRWPVAQRALFYSNGRMCRFPWLAWPGYPGFGLRAFIEGTRTLPRALQAMPAPDQSLASFLDLHAHSRGARLLVELLHSHVYAADPEEIGIRGPAEEERKAREEFGYRNFRLNEGYTELFRRQSAVFRDRVRTSSRISTVRRSPEGVAVQVQSGDRTDPADFHGRAAVVTFPLGVLKAGTVVFDPPLPAAKRAAINRIDFGMGYALQLRMAGDELRSRFGDFSVIWAGGATTFHRPGVRRRSGSEILTAFTVGREAKRRAEMGERERVEVTLAELSAALPSGTRIGQVAQYSVELWPQDPFSRGAYSFLPVGIDLKEREALAEPIDDALFFAGEATHRDGEAATVHGAIETGYRAAEEVRAALARRGGRNPPA
jgi:monoamine oxidase